MKQTELEQKSFKNLVAELDLSPTKYYIAECDCGVCQYYYKDDPTKPTAIFNLDTHKWLLTASKED